MEKNSDLSHPVTDGLSEEVIFKLSPYGGVGVKHGGKEGLRKRTPSAKAWRQAKSWACQKQKGDHCGWSTMIKEKE